MVRPANGDRVSIVDDDASVRRALARLLRSAGFEVEAYESSSAFLASSDECAARCLIVDVELPGMSGLDLQTRLVEMGVTTPVIILTAHDLPEYRNRAIDVGASDYLIKPVDDEILIGAIRNAIRSA